jgi:hypothetical protein
VLATDLDHKRALTSYGKKTLDSPETAEGMRCFSSTPRMSSQIYGEFIIDLLSITLDHGDLGLVTLQLFLLLDGGDHSP